MEGEEIAVTQTHTNPLTWPRYVAVLLSATYERRYAQLVTGLAGVRVCELGRVRREWRWVGWC